MTTSDGYALAFAPVVSHVAATLDRAAPAALSVGELAAGYRHPVPGDLARVRHHEGQATDADAITWLIGRALQELSVHKRRRQVVEEDGRFKLADGLRLAELRWQGEPVYEVRNVHAQLRDPFNPMSGKFAADLRAENLRDRSGKDLAELRESLRTFGWIEQLPAIQDERGVVLVGHRRLQAAALEGITPHVMQVELGDGDAADAKRFAIAIASNLGAAGFSQAERKGIAEYLYGEREWTMARIAEALSVSLGTVSDDLASFSPTEKPHRPKGGRPKGRQSTTKITPELEQDIERLRRDGQPVKRPELAARHNVSESTVRAADDRVRGRLEAEAPSANQPEATTPEPTPTAEPEQPEPAQATAPEPSPQQAAVPDDWSAALAAVMALDPEGRRWVRQQLGC